MLHYLPIDADHHGCCEVKNELEVDTSYEQLLERVVEEMQGRPYQLLYQFLFAKISSDLQKALESGLGKWHTSPILSDVERNMITFMEANVYRFSAAKTAAQVIEINKAFRSDITWSEFKKQVRGINDQFNVNWLRTETRTARGIGLSSSEFVAKEQTFPFVRWVQIDRVTKRQSHALLHGKVYKTSEIPALPPLDWNCGCRLDYLEDWEVDSHESKADFIERLKKSESGSSKYKNLYEQMKRYGFTKHKAKAGEVFDLNKTYGDEFNVSRLNWKNSGMKSFKEMDGFRMQTAIRDSRSYRDISSQPVNIKFDYAKRMINPRNIVSKKNYQHAWQLDSVLSMPDEVWLKQLGDGYRYSYFRFVLDAGKKTSIRVDVDVTRDGGMFLKSMSAGSDVDRFRNGVNVFNSKKAV